MVHKKHKNKHAHFKFKAFKDPFDYIIFTFSFVAPLFEIPQLLEIYNNKSSDNVAIATWLFFLVDNIVWITYGVKKKNWPIIISSSLYLIIEGLIVIGILIYT